VPSGAEGARSLPRSLPPASATVGDAADSPSDDDAALASLLHSLNLQHHLPQFRAQHIQLVDLPALRPSDLDELGLGLGGKRRLTRLIEQQGLARKEGEGAPPLAILLGRFGLRAPSASLEHALRRAGVTNALTLWAVREADLATANVPVGARRAVLRAGAATRELALLLRELQVPDGDRLLLSLFGRGIRGLDEILDASDSTLVAAGFGAGEVDRVRGWLEGYERNAAANSMTKVLESREASTPSQLSRSRRFQQPDRVSARSLPTDMQVMLMLSKKPAVGAQLRAQIATAGGQFDA
jgi:hypothetical protein